MTKLALASAPAVAPSTPRRPVMRYHGGKWMLGPWILGLMPAHHTYLEAFGGAASVLMRKRPSPVEVYNDLDGDVVGLFRVLRDPVAAVELERQLQLTPFSREEYRAAFDPSDDPVESARRLIVRAQMGFGSAAATRSRSGFRGQRASAAKSTAIEWKVRAADGLAQFTDRLLGVVIESEPAIDVCRRYDSPRTLHLLDPPYLHSTRAMGGGGQQGYRHEMSPSDHEALLLAARDLEGSVLICGYESDLYQDLLADWSTHQVDTTASGKTGGVRRRETVWSNDCASEGLMQRELAW